MKKDNRSNQSSSVFLTVFALVMLVFSVGLFFLWNTSSAAQVQEERAMRSF